MTPDRPVTIRQPRGASLACEDTAAALVVYAAQALALRGHSPRVTHENGPRLVRLGALMLAEFGVGCGRETEEEEEVRDG
jgi:hypothetical protein